MIVEETKEVKEVKKAAGRGGAPKVCSRPVFYEGRGGTHPGVLEKSAETIDGEGDVNHSWSKEGKERYAPGHFVPN